MIGNVFTVFVSVLGRCAAFLFSLPITDRVSVGSFLVAAGVMSVMIGVVFAGIRSFVAYENAVYDETQKLKYKMYMSEQRSKRC